MTPDECRRLRSGPSPGEEPAHFGLDTIVARCDDAEAVGRRVREILLSLPDLPDGAADDPERWRAALPEWFLAKLRPEWTDEELAAARAERGAMSREARTATVHKNPWALGSVLYQLERANRTWSWWDATVEDGGRTLRVEIVLLDWPSATDVLVFLLYAAGANQVEV